MPNTKKENQDVEKQEQAKHPAKQSTTARRSSTTGTKKTPSKVATKATTEKKEVTKKKTRTTTTKKATSKSPAKTTTAQKKATPQKAKAAEDTKKTTSKSPAKTTTAQRKPTPQKPKAAEDIKKTTSKSPAKTTTAQKKPTPQKAKAAADTKKTTSKSPTKTTTAQKKATQQKPKAAADTKKTTSKSPTKTTTAQRKPTPQKAKAAADTQKTTTKTQAKTTTEQEKATQQKPKTAADTQKTTTKTQAKTTTEQKRTTPQKSGTTAAKAPTKPTANNKKPAPQKSKPAAAKSRVDRNSSSTTAKEKQATQAKKKDTSQPKSRAAAGANKQPAKTQDNKQINNNKAPHRALAQEYKLLINADNREECRVALLEKGRLASFHIETIVSAQQKGNIYKGKVVSVEANLQAAFIDIGTGKNAFLAFSEIHPEYYAKEEYQDSHWKDLKIKEVIEEGQEMLVEVVKEATGNKGANITTYLSLPGRYVVLMPGSSSTGISRKIDKPDQRKKLREMLESCKLPEGVGYIIRTASKGITKTALTTDVRILLNLWKEIKEKGQSQLAPSLVYQEQNIVARFLRDHYTPDIHEIMVDSQDAYDQVINFQELLPAAQRKKTVAKLHKGPRPLLNSFNVEEQIEQIYHPTVKLPSGGSIVINPTEALVAIDVNSGRTDKNNNFEETIFLANMEAAEELARQLRLRDLGGLIVVDFIDMRQAAHTREVEKKVRNSMKRDKAKVDFCRISKFGLMQISRQRMAAPVLAGNYKTCDHCQGRGIIKSVETQALVYLRQIHTGATRKQVKVVHCRLPLEVGQYLLNKKRSELAELEKRYRTDIVIETVADMSPAQAKIQFIKG